nr:hypothetical protein Q903MT_gene2395 [Picea sitchensis]
MLDMLRELVSRWPTCLILLYQILSSTFRDLLRPIILSSLGAIPNSFIDFKTRSRQVEHFAGGGDIAGRQKRHQTNANY